MYTGYRLSLFALDDLDIGVAKLLCVLMERDSTRVGPKSNRLERSFVKIVFLLIHEGQKEYIFCKVQPVEWARSGHLDHSANRPQHRI